MDAPSIILLVIGLVVGIAFFSPVLHAILFLGAWALALTGDPAPEGPKSFLMGLWITADILALVYLLVQFVRWSWYG